MPPPLLTWPCPRLGGGGVPDDSFLGCVRTMSDPATPTLLTWRHEWLCPPPPLLQVEEVFTLGDLPKVAEILSSMRRSLSLVGDVPEFRAGRQKLRALEDRLQVMSKPHTHDLLQLYRHVPRSKSDFRSNDFLSVLRLLLGA